MALFSPSLGGSRTLIASDCASFRFLALPDAGTPGQLQVWTDLDGEWREHAFQQQDGLSGGLQIVDIPIAKASSSREFQYTYRLVKDDGNVQWLSQAGGTDNGRIIRSENRSDDHPHPLVEGDIRAQLQASSGGSAQVVRFTLADGGEGSVESFDLGVPRYQDLVGLTIEKTKPFWVTHRILNHASEVSSHLDSQLLLFSDAAEVTALLPLSSSVGACSLRGSLDGSGHVWLRSERDSSAGGSAVCIVATGPRNELLRILNDCADAARHIVNADASQPSKDDAHGAAPSFSLFGNKKAIYCTWNSLGPKYSLSRVLDRLQALQDHGSLDAYNAVLLDDGWQDVKGRTLASFGAKDGWLDVGPEDSLSESDLTDRDFRRKDSGVLVSRDPSEESPALADASLGTAVGIIKQRFPQIRAIGCWMTAQGYWNGLDGSGPLNERYKLVTLQRPKLEGYQWSHDAASITLPDPEQFSRFWHDYFMSLKSAGIDFVKVDNQADVDAYQGDRAGAVRSQLLPAMRKAAHEVFGAGNLINCMPAGAREFSGYLSTETDSKASMRTSDDFFPDIDASHVLHIANNATTGYLDRLLSIVRDFDMFMTEHETADFHGLLRAFSNAPLYITDKDEPNPAVLARLGGHAPDGEFRLLQADNGRAVKLPGQAFDDVTAGGPGPALKVGLPVETVGGAIIGVWSCRKDSLSTLDILTSQDVGEALRLLDSPGSARQYAVLEHATHAYKVISRPDIGSETADRLASALFSLSLPAGATASYAISPIEASEIGPIAVLGLQDKYVGLCAVARLSHEQQSPSSKVPSTVSTHETSKPASVEPREVSESTPLLQHAQKKPQTSTTGLKSRIWTLLLFWRRDLQYLRASLLRDFLRSPASTLFRELRAVFGGPSTVEIWAEAASRTPSIRSPETSLPPPDNTEAHSAEKTPAVVIEVSVAGKLCMLLPDAKRDDFCLRLGEAEIEPSAIDWQGDLVTIDIEKVLGGQFSSTRDTFRVVVSRK